MVPQKNFEICKRRLEGNPVGWTCNASGMEYPGRHIRRKHFERKNIKMAERYQGMNKYGKLWKN